MQSPFRISTVGAASSMICGIAAATGMSHESVRVNLHRGMKMLREKLGLEVKK